MSAKFVVREVLRRRSCPIGVPATVRSTAHRARRELLEDRHLTAARSDWLRVSGPDTLVIHGGGSVLPPAPAARIHPGMCWEGDVRPILPGDAA